MIAATVTVVIDKNTVDEKRETYVVPLRKIGDLMFVRAGQMAASRVGGTPSYSPCWPESDRSRPSNREHADRDSAS